MSGNSVNLYKGQRIRVEFPFYMGAHERRDACGDIYSDELWIPGCRNEPLPPDDSEFVADAMGVMILGIIDIHKPGKYPERVFYTRRWIDPEGNEFGAGKLHITTTATFKKRARGYYSEYRVS